MRSILIRLLRLLAVLFLVSLGTFFIIELVPGDPAVAILGRDATPERIEEIHTELGLDEPIGERYVDWLQGVLHGDLGNSLVNPSQSVSDLIKQSLPVTLQIAFMALLLSLLISIPTTLISAAKSDGVFDRGTMVFTSALISIPTFLAALLLAYFFVFEQSVPRWTGLLLGLIGAAAMLRSALPHDDEGFRPWFVVGAIVLAGIGLAIWNWFPNFDRTGFIRITAEEGIRENIESAFLPALTWRSTEVAVFSRLLRSDMITTLQEDYVLSARAKGMPTRRRARARRPAAVVVLADHPRRRVARPAARRHGDRRDDLQPAGHGPPDRARTG